MTTYKKRLPPQDVFAIASICACIASLSTSVSLVATGLGNSNFGSGLIASFVVIFFSIPPFLVVFSTITFMFNLIAGHASNVLVRWFYFPVIGAGAGFGIPFIIGAMVGAPRMVAISGLVGGIACAGLWGYFIRRRERFPSETNKKSA